MTAKAKKILLSGVKSTGRPHLGNYFGAMKQYVDLQNNYEAYIFVADFHALTSVQNAEELAQSTYDLVLDFLAIELDPKTVTIFKQSDVPQVTELGWIFNCLTTMSYLERAHAYKDAVSKGREVNVGTFDYPMLMAADILIQDADVVPVGQDQKQHVEYARDTAEKFNRIFGQAFKLPESLILENVKVVPGIDGQKMSKSYNNTIPLFASDDEIKKAVMSIVTDSDSGVPTNVRAIHSLLRDEKYLNKLYQENAGKYQKLKEALIDDLINFIRPLREKRAKLAEDRQAVLEIITTGGEKARARAESKMELVRNLTGLNVK